MTIQRGTGRSALISAAADALLRGDEVRLGEVAAAAGVSHTLVYRHFPDGGRDELLAEACVLLFKGLTEGDFEALAQLFADPAVARALTDPVSAEHSGTVRAAQDADGELRQRLMAFLVGLLHPRRTAIRTARLQALVQAQTNPFVAQRLDDVRRTLVDDLADLLQAAVPSLPRDRAVGLSIIAQAVPLGITAIAGGTMSQRERRQVAIMWTDMLLSVFHAGAGIR